MVAVDTNIWIYLFSKQDEKKRLIVEEVIASLSVKGIVISSQIFKEIAKVLSVDFKLSAKDTIEVLSKIEKLAIVRHETQEDIKLAVKVRERFNLQFFDSVIVAFCLNRNIKVLITEDKFIDKVSYQEKELLLMNPFKSTTHL